PTPIFTLFPYTTLFRSKVFDFPWDTLYIFYPLIYPEDIENDTGINYKGNVVPDDTYLFVFVSDGTIIREIKSRPFRISFENELRSEEHTSELQSRENLV